MQISRIVFCAGEDSGDILGEILVREAVRRGYSAVGAGGQRMQLSGLELLVDYENLPVSGYLDVFLRIKSLSKARKILESVLREDDCVALVCIDYPGFNMRLCSLAKSLGKPVLYVAPPQVWAWKSYRAKKLKEVSLAVLFDFEQKNYQQHGCRSSLLKHPLVQFVNQADENSEIVANPKKLLLLPGSRKSQALRNLNFYMDIVSKYREQNPEITVTVLASREPLVDAFRNKIQKRYGESIPTWIDLKVSPLSSEARLRLIASYGMALSAPGSSTLEVALAKVPVVVTSIVDFLTFAFGKLFVRTRLFSLPNIILHSRVVPERLYCAPFCFLNKGRLERNVDSIVRDLESTSKVDAVRISSMLASRLAAGKSMDSLMSEFLGKLV